MSIDRIPRSPSSVRALRRSAPAIALVLTVAIAACGGGGTGGGGSDLGPPADPAGAIVGTWEMSNEAGTLSYEFGADGRFRWRSKNRFQTMDGRGRYEVEGDRIALTFDDDPDGEGTFYVVFVGPDQIRDEGDDIDLVYRRR